MLCNFLIVHVFLHIFKHQGMQERNFGNLVLSEVLVWKKRGMSKDAFGMPENIH